MDINLKIPEMLTIKETKVRYDLPEHCVRRMVADGCVVSIRAGRKFLVNAASVTRYLETGIPQGTAATAAPRRSDGETAPRIAPISLR